MVDLGIQFLQQVVGFVLLLQFFVGRNVSEIYDETLLFVEIKKPSIYHYGLGFLILGVDAVRGN